MNKQNGIRSWLLRRCTAAAAALALACGGDVDAGHDHDSESEEGANYPPSGAECPSGSTLSYETFGKPFMDKYCVRCHASTLKAAARNGAPDGHDFDRLDGIRPVIEHIDQRAAAGPKSVNSQMPPGDPRPTEDERRQLGAWLACEEQRP